MKSAKRIADELAPAIRRNNASIGEVNRRLVKIGDGSGNPAPPNPLDPREVYYRNEQDSNDRGIALLGQECGIAIQAIDGFYDVAVYLANIPGSSYPIVTRIADVRGQTTGSMSPMEGLISAAAHPDISRIVNFRLHPSIGGGISVFVDVGPYAVRYEDASGNNQFFRSQDFGFENSTDSLIYSPTASALTAGQHRIIGIAFNPSTGNLVAIPGAAATAASTLPSQDSRSEFVDADYAAIDFTGLNPGGYVYRYYGQTDVEEDDCLRHYEPRTLSAVAGNSGSALIDSIATDKFGTIAVDSVGNVATGR